MRQRFYAQTLHQKCPLLSNVVANFFVVLRNLFDLFRLFCIFVMLHNFVNNNHKFKHIHLII